MKFIAATIAAAAFAVGTVKAFIPGPDGYVNKGECFDICYNKKSVTCFNKESCGNKTGAIGDYDYLLLDQLWVPQFCQDLSNGKDVTITFPANSTCNKKDIENKLVIHGLWPNYKGGYMGCCNSTSVTNIPLDAHDWSSPKPFSKQARLLKKLKKEWALPVGRNDTAATCYTWNHEFQKHGYCGEWLTPESYFKSTFKVNKKVEEQTEKVNKLGSCTKTKNVMPADLRALYPKAIQLVCSSTNEDKGKNLLSAIRTCWSRRSLKRECAGMQPIDCEPLTGASVCNETMPITFLKAPSSSYFTTFQ